MFVPATENIHLLAAVLRSGEEPVLSRAQMQRVHYAHRAHKEYLKYVETLQDSDDDEGPQDEEAWLFEDLAVLARLYSRIKDREELIEIIFEVSDILKHRSGLCTERTVGIDGRSVEGHHHNILCTFGPSLPRCQHRGFIRRYAELHQRPHTYRGVNRRKYVGPRRLTKPVLSIPRS